MSTTRETKAQRASRVSLLLAEYDAESSALRKSEKRVKDLKAQIRAEVEPGTYGEWMLAHGTPREIMDQAAAKNALTEHGIPVPMVMTMPPLVVSAAVTTNNLRR